MKILVSGGTGVIGVSSITELLSRGHSVRLLSRHAREDAKQWDGVEAFEGNVADAESIRGAAEGCDAVLHIAGIAAEEPPDVTFEKVNVGGTRNLLAEAGRASARRFIFISSLGADRGSTAYHQSKRESEKLVEASALDWTIVRPGNVYGPGDEVISTVLKMVRTLPAIPVVDDGDQKFQPVWHRDLAQALASLVEVRRYVRETIELAGAEITSLNDLLERLGTITGRKPVRIPIPSALASLGARVASMAAHFPLDETKITMLQEENVVGGKNPLQQLGVDPTPLDEGLAFLADDLPEKLPEDGVGSLQHKQFFADIRGSRYSPAGLMELFRDRVSELMPIDFSTEPETPQKVVKGATLTMALPLRGNIQVRVEVAEPRRVVFATLEGHPLAGIVQFTTAETDGALRFAIDVYTRASNFLDWIGMTTVGRPAQSANWRAVVQSVVDASGGTSEGVETEVRTLDDDEAARVEKDVRSMVQERRREESAEASR